MIESGTTVPTTPVGYAGSDTIISKLTVLRHTTDDSPNVRSLLRSATGDVRWSGRTRRGAGTGAGNGVLPRRGAAVVRNHGVYRFRQFLRIS